jgi:hypothetical protein
MLSRQIISRKGELPELEAPWQKNQAGHPVISF